MANGKYRVDIKWSTDIPKGYSAGPAVLIESKGEDVINVYHLTLMACFLSFMLGLIVG